MKVFCSEMQYYLNNFFKLQNGKDVDWRRHETSPWGSQKSFSVNKSNSKKNMAWRKGHLESELKWKKKTNLLLVEVDPQHLIKMSKKNWQNAYLLSVNKGLVQKNPSWRTLYKIMSQQITFTHHLQITSPVKTGCKISCVAINYQPRKLI